MHGRTIVQWTIFNVSDTDSFNDIYRFIASHEGELAEPGYQSDECVGTVLVGESKVSLSKLSLPLSEPARGLCESFGKCMEFVLIFDLYSLAIRCIKHVEPNLLFRSMQQCSVTYWTSAHLL